MDTESIIHNVTNLALEAIQSGESGAADVPERLRFELDRLQQKKEAVMDHYFSGDISKADMFSMKRRYEAQETALQERMKTAEQRLQEGRSTLQLKEAIQGEVTALLKGEMESTVLSKQLVDRLTVFKDKHMELRLMDLPQIFRFV